MLLVRMETEDGHGPFFCNNDHASAYSRAHREAARAGRYYGPSYEWPGGWFNSLRPTSLYACQGLKEFLTWWPCEEGRETMAREGSYPAVYYVPKEYVEHCSMTPQCVYEKGKATWLCWLDPVTLKPLKGEKGERKCLDIKEVQPISATSPNVTQVPPFQPAAAGKAVPTQVRLNGTWCSKSEEWPKLAPSEAWAQGEGLGYKSLMGQWQGQANPRNREAILDWLEGDGYTVKNRELLPGFWQAVSKETALRQDSWTYDPSEGQHYAVVERDTPSDLDPRGRQDRANREYANKRANHR